jgi:septum formation inhibitor MinC
MAVNDLSGQNIQDTFQKVVQTDGINLADGTGSKLPIEFNENNVVVSGSFSTQASGHITASGNISASGNLTGNIITGTINGGNF